MADDNTKCDKSGILIHQTELRDAKTECCDEVYKDCFKGDPFFDKLLNTSVCVPAVGEIVSFAPCNPNLYTVGQWVYIKDLGRFPIVEINNGIIKIRNSHDDSEAISGNNAPGTCVSGTVKLWVIDRPDRLEVDVSDAVVQKLNTSTSICLDKQIDQEPQEEKVFLWGLFEKCTRLISSIFSFNNTLCFPDIPAVDYKDPLDGVTGKRVIMEADDCDCDDSPQNCLKIENLPPDNGIEKFCGGARRFIAVPNDFEEKQYVLGVDIDGDAESNSNFGCPTWRELDIKDCYPKPLDGGDPHLVVVKSGVNGSASGSFDLSTVLSDIGVEFDVCWAVVLIGMRMSPPAFKVTISGADSFSIDTIQDSVWHGENITYTVHVPLINGTTFNWEHEAMNSSGDAFTLRVVQVFAKNK